MLENQGYIHYNQMIFVEWQQASDEGYLVDHLKEQCEALAGTQLLAHLDGENEAKSVHSDLNQQALALKEQLYACPKNPNYPFVEPSEYEEILLARPKKRFAKTAYDKSTIATRIHGAWTGRIAGCLLGKPVEGLMSQQIHTILKGQDNFPLSRYMRIDKVDKSIDIDLSWREYMFIDKVSGSAPSDDDTNYTVFALKLVKKYGKNFTSQDVLEGWLSDIPYLATFTAERVAYKNAAVGLLPPYTATTTNPYREWIGAQIRGDFYGYINPGDPQAAAEMAFRDAYASHTKNGIYGEMLMAAMIAAAAVTNNTLEIVAAGLGEIPEFSRLKRDIDLVVEWYKAGKDSTFISAEIHKLYNEHTSHGWCHTNSNAMLVVMALLCSEMDYGKSICLAVQDGFDTDCNGATVGSIVGMANGSACVDAQWSDPWCNMLQTSLTGYPLVSVDELVRETLELID